MFFNKYVQNCKKIYEKYGKFNQKLKLIEECSELIRAIVRKDKENIKEEIADVLVLIDQILGNDPILKKEVLKIKEQKAARQVKRIEKGIYE